MVPSAVDDSLAKIKMANGVSDNQVFVLREKGHFCYETRPMPTLPSENHVVIAVCTTGLCGSDVCAEQPSFPVVQFLMLISLCIRRFITGPTERSATSRSDS